MTKSKYLRAGCFFLALCLSLACIIIPAPAADAVTTENGQSVYNWADFAGSYFSSYDVETDEFSTTSFEKGSFPLTFTWPYVGKNFRITTSSVVSPLSADDLTFRFDFLFPVGAKVNSFYIYFSSFTTTYNYGDLVFYDGTNFVFEPSILSLYACFDLPECVPILRGDDVLGFSLIGSFLSGKRVSTMRMFFSFDGYDFNFSSYDDLIFRVGTASTEPNPTTPTVPGITFVNNPDSDGVFNVFEGEQYTQAIDITNVNGTPSANIVIGGTSYPMTISPGSNGTTYRATYTGSAGPPGTQQLSYEVFNELNGETASAVSDNYTLQSFVVPTVPTINVVGGETTTWDVILGEAVDFSVFGEGVNANGLVGLYVNGQLIADKVAALEYGVSSWSHTFQFSPDAVGDYEIYAVIDNNSGGLNNGRTESAQSQVITLHVVEASALPDWLVELKNWLASQFADNRAWMETWFQALSEDIQAVVQAVKDLGGGIASIPGNVTDAVEEVTGKVEEITGKLDGVAGREDELVGDANDKLDNLPPEIGVTPADPVTGDNVDYTVVENNVVLTQIFDFAPVKGMLMVYSAFLVINAVFLGKWWGTRKEKG